MKYAGLILLIAGIFTAFGGVGNLAPFQIIFGAVMAFFGNQLYNKKPPQISTTQTYAKQKFELTDEMIIRLANRLGNKLCVEDLIQQTSLTREQAKERLENLHGKGICQINLDSVQETGKIYYNF